MSKQQRQWSPLTRADWKGWRISYSPTVLMAYNTDGSGVSHKVLAEDFVASRVRPGSLPDAVTEYIEESGWPWTSGVLES